MSKRACRTKVPSPCACTVLSGEGVTEERHEESITKNEKKEYMQAAATESELSQARDKSKRTRGIIHMKNMARPTQEQMLQQVRSGWDLRCLMAGLSHLALYDSKYCPGCAP